MVRPLLVIQNKKKFLHLLCSEEGCSKYNYKIAEVGTGTMMRKSSVDVGG